ncbi:MAG: DUF2835 domain-containing protein [Cellvibrio sp.]
MQSINVRIDISPEEYQRAYLGVKTVSAIADDGRRIQFPANILRAYVLHSGVRGYFRIHFDEQHKFSHIEKLAELP